MSFPVQFEQSPKSEDDKTAQHLDNNQHLNDIREGQKDEKVTIQLPDWKLIPKEENNPPLNDAKMEKKHLEIKETKNLRQKGRGDSFPLAKEDADPEQLQCQYCGNTKCKWCEENIGKLQ